MAYALGKRVNKDIFYIGTIYFFIIIILYNKMYPKQSVKSGVMIYQSVPFNMIPIEYYSTLIYKSDPFKMVKK